MPCCPQRLTCRILPCGCLFLLAGLWQITSTLALGQQAAPSATPAAADQEPPPTAVQPPLSPVFTTAGNSSAKHPVESNIVVEGLVSYGNYRLLASAEDCKLYDVGIEYDRHSWGRFLGARRDYVAEILPVLLLNQPARTDIWGGPLTSSRKTLAGLDISPIGVRLLWRDTKAVKPYLVVKGGMLSFTQKALSQKSTYENFSLQSATGVQLRITERADLRLGLFGDFHFSNGFITPVDPGLDVMNATLGLSYHLGRAASH